MKTLKATISILTVLAVCINCHSQELSIDELIQKEGTLVFEDDFNRNEANETEENLGNNWVTNSAKEKLKQVDLTDGTILVAMGESAGHGVSVRHESTFNDGVIQARIKIFDEKGLGINIVDHNYKGSSFGHICQVKIATSAISFRDGKNGQFNHKIRKLKKEGASKSELNKLLKGTKFKFEYNTTPDEWHDVAIYYKDDTAKVFIDGDYITEFSAKGFNHETKQTLALSVWGKVQIDYVKVWGL